MNKTRLHPILLLACVLFAGCANLYTGIVTFRDVRDVALKNWAAASHNGQTTLAIDNAVIAQDAKVQQAAKVAEDALKAYQANGDKAAYVQALSVLQVAVGDLVNIIVPVLTPAQATNLKTLQGKASKP